MQFVKLIAVGMFLMGILSVSLFSNVEQIAGNQIIASSTGNIAEMYARGANGKKLIGKATRHCLSENRTSANLPREVSNYLTDVVIQLSLADGRDQKSARESFENNTARTRELMRTSLERLDEQSRLKAQSVLTGFSKQPEYLISCVANAIKDKREQET